MDNCYTVIPVWILISLLSVDDHETKGQGIKVICQQNFQGFRTYSKLAALLVFHHHHDDLYKAPLFCDGALCVYVVPIVILDVDKKSIFPEVP